ncbi:MAG: NAD-dependent deacylase [Bacteroidales bacterium]|nr:NAD-dependent deacylase [Bacteroidales bacterium]
MIKQAADLIHSAKRVTVFTGAGISVESGIPPFRGEDGLWAKYDPIILDLDFYHKRTNESWPIIKELFFDFFGKAKPNAAHKILAKWEQEGIITDIITQNIDNLHQEAGSKNVYEFHGTANSFICTKCDAIYKVSDLNLTNTAPHCMKEHCHGLLKPNFIFFGEGIPTKTYEASLYAAQNSDVFIIIGTTGEIMPASQIPIIAKQKGAKIIEINIAESNFTHQITDIFLKGKATEILKQLNNAISAL